jgi:predicted DNA-binding transcriptional regulator YafY
MPINKNALLRYQILDRCFSDRHHRYEIEDLVDKVNDALFDMYGKTVSLRQIRADITYLRDRVAYNAPIVARPIEGRRCYYTYEDPHFSIFNNELSVQEVTELRSTIDTLSRYRGIPGNVWLEEIISKLEYRFGIKTNRENIVVFEQNEKLKGLEFLSAVIDAAINRKTLQLQYRTYGGKETSSIIHPYHVREYNNRWFLFGLEESSNGSPRIANRPLDRIVKLSLSDVEFIPNTIEDFSTRFDDIVGVSTPDPPGNIEHVQLKFDEDRYPYIVSKPIHQSQTIVSNEEHIIQIDVRPNKELKSIIFSFCPHVEVLSPEWLRQEIKDNIEENLKKYITV